MKSNALSRIIKIVLSVLAVFLLFWFMLPPLNPRSPQFWIFLISCILVCLAINFFSAIVMYLKENTEGGKFHPRKPSFSSWGKILKIIGIVFIVIVAILIIGSIIGSQLFNAGKYNKLIAFEEGNFTEDVSEIKKDQIPVVDKDTASRLGKRKLGEISEYVSQFEIMDIYTQINYHGKPVRVTPLIYGDIIKWFNNRSEGIPAYIMVDMTTQKATINKVEDGIKYSTGEYFMRNVERYLRFKYPSKIFGNISFEIDEEGTPYWVVSTVKYRIGLWSGSDIGGVILLNAVNGECEYHDIDEVKKDDGDLQWIDQVYDSDLVLEHLNYNGKYRSGFFNSIFGQKGVLQATEGYNYLAIDDDVYLYTGMTSVTSDESNVGFVLTNLRTKQTKYYEIPGAEEYSAMESAEGQVQHLSYSATFPLLLNVSERPTYFMSLKDSAGLVKMYAFVDVEQYQIVGTGTTVDEARENYITNLGKNDLLPKESEKNEEIEGVTKEKTEAVITRISSAVVDSNTKYYITLEGSDEVIIVPVTWSDKLPFAAVGDTAVLTHTITEVLDEDDKPVTERKLTAIDIKFAQ